jgi:murein L,D-transpeptidase YafK
MRKPDSTHLLPLLAAFLLLFLPFSAAAELPSSQTSIAVCRRVGPSLAMELSSRGLALGSPIFIRIFKKSQELEVWVQAEEGYRLFKTYDICYFSGDLGPKTREGDRQSPEGFYTVGAHQLNPNSRYHLSFDLGYPNAYDKQYGRTGSALMIHGDCISVGCFAMTDSRIEEIYTLAEEALRNGQRFFQVHIFPFEMTAANMKKYKNSKWISFWKNLQEGYDWFEKTNMPPKISVAGKRYIIEPGYQETAAEQRRPARIFN